MKLSSLLRRLDLFILSISVLMPCWIGAYPVMAATRQPRPTVRSFSINSGAAATGSKVVTLSSKVSGVATKYRATYRKINFPKVIHGVITNHL